MRLFAVSDLHLDYEENRDWLKQLSDTDYNNDVLLLGGDISDDVSLIQECFEQVSKRFGKIFYVPGNHDIWDPGKSFEHSLAKFHYLLSLADEYGISTQREILCLSGDGLNKTDVQKRTSLDIRSDRFLKGTLVEETLLEIVPLFSWYDFSFGEPTLLLNRSWMDFRRCHWPAQLKTTEDICQHFLELNESKLYSSDHQVISFSHFLPRIDIMPARIPQKYRVVYPVLGSHSLEAQVRMLGSTTHVYGHSHVQVDTVRDGVRYLNSAVGYPNEFWLDKKLTLVAKLA